MEVDHFDPTKKKNKVQRYSNLVLATRSCNGAKRNTWPSGKQRSQGKRFIDCTKEEDYGVHIFEDPETHELVGATPAGKYQILHCDLNAPHLVRERKTRAHLRSGLADEKIWRLLKKSDILSDLQNFEASMAAVSEILETLIPPIPSPPVHLVP